MRFFFALIGIFFLTSCSSDTEVQTLKRAATPAELITELSLTVVEERVDETIVGIHIHNPKQHAIQSVRAWVKFNPDHFAVTNLVTHHDAFSLFAPGERSVDADDGMVRLGSATRTPVTDERILFATFAARSLQSDVDQLPLLTFYDWRADGTGHTAVLAVSERQARNLVELPSPLSL